MVLADFIPSAVIAQIAMRFKSRISVKHEGKFIDAKSVNMLKIRGLTKGTWVTVKAEGFDAEEAVKTFNELWLKGWQKNHQ
ncbi:MAG: HPr family phosphocarrier protein [Selenomonadaceae bacterium]|nr:HPr family phosphocarrier protein [Selenomonadaceae bacterium]